MGTVFLVVARVGLPRVMILVGVFGICMGGGTTIDVSMYPYTLLDPFISGGGTVVAFVAAMIVVLGYVLFGADRFLGRIGRRR